MKKVFPSLVFAKFFFLKTLSLFLAPKHFHPTTYSRLAKSLLTVAPVMTPAIEGLEGESHLSFSVDCLSLPVLCEVLCEATGHIKFSLGWNLNILVD